MLHTSMSPALKGGFVFSIQLSTLYKPLMAKRHGCMHQATIALAAAAAT
jgi:hypothetical protein